MENPDFLNLEVGQLAEMKTFEGGYRGAWFRCKIRDISPRKDKIKPEYYDFPGEEITWTQVYQVPSYGRKSRHIKKQLMVRPQYPPIYDKSEMIPVALIPKVCVIVDGTWKVGDLVDWHEQHCYWSARVVEVLSDDKVQIELPMDPVGEGGTYEAFCKDLRPSLDWNPRNGWTLRTVDGQISCSAQLIIPSKQGMNSEVENAAASPLHASASSHISVNSLAVPFEAVLKPMTRIVFEDDFVESAATGKASSSDSISTSHVQVDAAATSESEPEDVDSFLNIMHQDILEAPILDLEELANKLKWMKTILKTNQSTSSSWEFLEHNSN